MKNKISRSILKVCLAFSLAIAIGIGLIGLTMYVKGTMKAYENDLISAVSFAKEQIDVDSVQKNIETLTVDDSYCEMQHMLNELRDTHFLKYLYIIKPIAPSGNDSVMYIMTGESEEELNTNYINGTPLGIMSGDTYSNKISKFYYDCMSNDEFSFFANRTQDFGFLYTAVLPIENDDGEIIALLGADVLVQEIFLNIFKYFVVFVIGSIVVCSLFLLVVYKWMKNKVIDPVKALDESARNFVNEAHKDKKPEDLIFVSPNIQTGDEIQTLQDSLCKMSDDIKQYVADILVQTQKNARIASELNVAKKIQEEMLPNKFPPFPNNNQFDIYAKMVPAKEVGGDFYDFFFIDEKKLVLVMADVSDKSVPAALFMVSAKTLLKSRALKGGSPSEILSDVNLQLCDGNESKMFVTVWMAIIDVDTGHCVVSNAGHEDPAICHIGENFELIKSHHSLPLGVISGSPFFESEFNLNLGDVLFAYTDGVVEAINENGTMFGFDRMLNALNINKDKKLDNMLESVENNIFEFIGKATQFDDITMLGFKYIAGKK